MRYIFLLYTCFSSFLIATELDSFSLRDLSLKDATHEINHIMNSYIQESIKEANEWGICDEEAFRENLHHRMSGIFWTDFENKILNSSIEYYSVSRAESIYQDISFFKAPALYLAKLGPLLRLGEYFIGSDKFGHFIAQGYDYYRMIYHDNKSLEEALDFGEKTENTYFGLESTAIYSYADLTANYHGLEFWKKIIHSAPQIDSYVSCHNNYYYRTNFFDWRDYIDAAWDEAINCNAYRSQEIANLVASRIAKIGKERGIEDLRCPIAAADCKALIPLYGDRAPRLISPQCF
jgi:hypothetical protein